MDYFSFSFTLSVRSLKIYINHDLNKINGKVSEKVFGMYSNNNFNVSVMKGLEKKQEFAFYVHLYKANSAGFDIKVN